MRTALILLFLFTNSFAFFNTSTKSTEIKKKHCNVSCGICILGCSEQVDLEFCSCCSKSCPNNNEPEPEKIITDEEKLPQNSKSIASLSKDNNVISDLNADVNIGISNEINNHNVVESQISVNSHSETNINIQGNYGDGEGNNYNPLSENVPFDFTKSSKIMNLPYINPGLINSPYSNRIHYPHIHSGCFYTTQCFYVKCYYIC